MATKKERTYTQTQVREAVNTYCGDNDGLSQNIFEFLGMDPNETVWEFKVRVVRRTYESDAKLVLDEGVLSDVMSDYLVDFNGDSFSDEFDVVLGEPTRIS